MNLDQEALEHALRLLGELMEVRKIDPQHLVVCGGAALLIWELTSRVTGDVDVIARRGLVDGELLSGRPLPDHMAEAIKEIGTQLRLRKDWLNTSAALFAVGTGSFPATEFWRDLETRDYGPQLTVSYIGRSGQLYLKFHAAVDRFEPRDIADLKAINPSHEELERVKAWLVDEEIVPADSPNFQNVWEAIFDDNSG